MRFASALCMSQGVKWVRFQSDEPRTVARAASPQVELKHFRSVTGGVVQDALSVWADLWGELEDGIDCTTVVNLGADKGFEPSCGWPEFLEKMWVLRHHLEFVARFSRQRSRDG